MSSGNGLSQNYNERYNDLHALYEEGGDKLQACEDGARDLLDDKNLPRLHQIKTLLLLASIVAHVSEAWDMRQEAETLWRIERRVHPEGQEAELDSILDELSLALQQIKTLLSEELVAKHQNSAEDDEASAAMQPEGHKWSTDGILRDSDAKYLKEEREFYRRGARSLKRICEDVLEESKSAGTSGR
nr:hypothetical protein B0A51_06277 [Rachicladosporium sp. CCFEE 5018]